MKQIWIFKLEPDAFLAQTWQLHNVPQTKFYYAEMKEKGKVEKHKKVCLRYLGSEYPEISIRKVFWVQPHVLNPHLIFCFSSHIYFASTKLSIRSNFWLLDRSTSLLVHTLLHQKSPNIVVICVWWKIRANQHTWCLIRYSTAGVKFQFRCTYQI